MIDTNRDFFEVLSRVLFRCWILGFGLMFFSLAIFLLSGDLVERMHGQLFGLTAHELDLIMYCGLGLLKAGILLLFLIPWIGIRLELRKENTNH